MAATSPSARLDARLLAGHCLGVGETWLIAHGRDEIDRLRGAEFETLVERRARGEPIAYILGTREFYGRSFRVSPDTLIPRPETEHLVEAALTRLSGDQPVRALDIGTGTGCIAITLKLERPNWRLNAVDISPAALTLARVNAERLGATVNWLTSDLYSALSGLRFDLIVSNPPYVASGDAHLAQGDLRFEPTAALVSGVDGLEALRDIVKSAPTHLEHDGWLMLEHGHEQG